MRKRYFGEENLFAHIWNDADKDGIWAGNDGSIAAAFGVTEDDAYAMLSELCDRALIQKLAPAKFIITNWRERDEASDVE